MENEDKVLAYLESHTTTQTAKKFGVSRISIYELAVRRGIDMKNRKYGRGVKSNLIADSGLLGTMSDVEVAKRLGYSHGWVSEVRRKLGIKAYEG